MEISEIYENYCIYVDDAHRYLGEKDSKSMPAAFRTKMSYEDFQDWWQRIEASENPQLAQRWIDSFELGFAEDVQKAKQFVSDLRSGLRGGRGR